MARASYRDVVRDGFGNALAGAQVELRVAGTATKIGGPIYADGSSATQLPNPLSADSRGYFEFYLAAPQTLDLYVTAPGYVATTVANASAAVLATLDGALLLDGTVATAKLLDQAVTAAKLADSSVTSAKLVDGTIATADLADGTVTTAKVAAGAVTQSGLAVGSSSGPTTTSTSYVDLADLAVTLTTGGGDLLVWASGSFQNSGAVTPQYLALALDGAAEVAEQLATVAGAGYAVHLHCVHRFSGVSPGAHTVKARWKVGGNTGTAFGTDRTLLVLEVKR